MATASNPFSRRSLYYRVCRTFLLLLVTLAVFISLLHMHFQRRHSDRITQELGWFIARNLAQRMPTLDAAPTEIELREWFDRQLEINPELAAYLLDQDGRITYSFSRRPTQRGRVLLAPLRAFLEHDRDAPVPLYNSDPSSRRTEAVFSVWPVNRGSSAGYLYVVLGNTETHVLSLLGSEDWLARGALSSFVLALLLVFAFGVLLFRSLTRRFSSLISSVQRIERGDLAMRVPNLQEDELGALGRAINSMADAIEQNVADLKDRDERRRELIRSVSHDLRGPVALIKGYTELLHAKALDTAIPALEEYCTSIDRNIDALLKLLSDLMELAKLEAKEIRPAPIAFSAPLLLDDVALRFQPHAHARGTSLTVEGPEDLPPVMGDPALIERALSNLVDNALRYTGRGGAVTLSALPCSAEEIELIVTDDGSGIAAESAGEIFSAGVQAPQTEETKGFGGLGLAIVQRIVAAHGSAVVLEHNVPTGAIFRFRLPVADRASLPHFEETTERPQLVVESDSRRFDLA